MSAGQPARSQRCRTRPVMVAVYSRPEALPDGFAAEPVYLVWEEDGELLVHPGLLHLQRPLSVSWSPTPLPHHLLSWPMVLWAGQRPP